MEFLFNEPGHIGGYLKLIYQFFPYHTLHGVFQMNLVLQSVKHGFQMQKHGNFKRFISYQILTKHISGVSEYILPLLQYLSGVRSIIPPGICLCRDMFLHPCTQQIHHKIRAVSFRHMDRKALFQGICYKPADAPFLHFTICPKLRLIYGAHFSLPDSSHNNGTMNQQF